MLFHVTKYHRDTSALLLAGEELRVKTTSFAGNLIRTVNLSILLKRRQASTVYPITPTVSRTTVSIAPHHFCLPTYGGGKEITDEERGAILALPAAKTSEQDISRRVGRSKTTIHNLLVSSRSVRKPSRLGRVSAGSSTTGNLKHQTFGRAVSGAVGLPPRTAQGPGPFQNKLLTQ